MLSHVAPSSPPDMRTLHLLRTPDILCANDNRQPGNYQVVNNLAQCYSTSNFRMGHDPPRTHKNALHLSERVGLYCQSINLNQPLPKTNRGSIVDERP